MHGDDAHHHLRPDRLIDDLDLLDWTDAIKSMPGADRCALRRRGRCPTLGGGTAGEIAVFTTRPDTLFGAVAPSIPSSTNSPSPSRLTALYSRPTARRTSNARTTREKTGVFTGSYAADPVGEQMPVWIADYVLMGYGHHGGAVRRPA